ncbi:MAG: copper resistance protein CopC [Halofilum sp. (in: g-proteobacteria)]|nr:copper resistance protein CopC [Halofilum sp. (in: g-proteobacteria)]
MSFPVWRGVAAALLLAFATAASGHSASDATTPSDGAVLDAPPEEIRIRFDQPIRVTMVRITDEAGNEYDVAYDRGAATKILIGRTESLASGAYTVEWRGLSTDGHTASGEFGFRVE